MRVILQILALIALIIVAIVFLAVAKTFVPKHPATQSPDAAATTTASTTATSTSTVSSTEDLIHVSSPLPGATTTSPLKVSGEARGMWYFEASFPIVIVDWDGRIIGEGHAEANGDWMTSDFVPFTGAIPFVKPDCAEGADYCRRGAVILKNDNPSGDPERDKALEIPVIFQ